MSQGTLYAGTSGWNYPHWAKGRFYPSGMKQGNWLPFYAGHFPTVEVNMTFYRLPAVKLTQRWHDIAPETFLFTIKLWRRITHLKRLADCDVELRQVVEAVAPLRTKRGPLLVQLPPSMRKDPVLLDQFLAKTSWLVRDRPWRVAVEFRNAEWLCETVREVLDQHGAALCLADMPRCPVNEPNAAPFVYIRRHGPGGRYRGCYAAEHITSDAARIQQWLDQGRDVYIYYNNDIEGHAVDNAQQLVEAVCGPKRPH